MDAAQNPDGSPEYQHPPLVNQNPFTASLNSAVEFLQTYGWFLLLGGVAVLYIYYKLMPKVEKMRRQFEEDRESKKFDVSAAQARLEAMEASRRRLQEQHDAQAAEHAEKMRQKEEEKRQQRIQDWEGHQQGKGYRSKFKPKEESSSTSKLPKPKSKPLRSPDFNPLAGDGGSCSWRPAQRRSGGG